MNQNTKQTSLPLERPALVNNKGFLNSARDAGLTTLDAVCELIDNSFDAGANNIDVLVDQNGKYLRIAVVDDGVGIPEGITGENGKTYDGIGWALSFGGRAPTGLPGTAIGRFGAGLTYAACCQSLRTAVYSKTAGEKGGTRYNVLDLEVLGQSDDLHVQLSVRNEPPAELCSDWTKRLSGTMVVLEKCDNPDRTTVGKMVELLMGHLGMVYRRFIVGGRTIKVGTKTLDPKDPLFATRKGWHTYDPAEIKDGESPPDAIPLVKGTGDDPSTIVFDKVIPFPEYKDEFGSPHQVHIRIAWLDVLGIRKNPNYTPQFMTKHGLTEEKQGFYLMRHDRQIAEAESFGPRGLFVRNADLNYFRGEISFPPALDKLFGIQQNKSRFSIKEGVKQRLEEELGSIIEDIRRDTRSIIKAWQEQMKAAQAEALGPTPAEKIMKKGMTTLATPATLDVKGLAQEQKAVEEQTRIKVSEVKANPILKDEQKAQLLAEIQAAAEKAKLPFTIKGDVIADGCFYHLKRLGPRVIVVVNTGHEFNTLFEKASKDPTHRGLLELLLLTAGHGEANFKPDEFKEDMNMTDAIESFRHHWSVALNVVLKKMRDEEVKLFHEEEPLVAP